MVSDGFCMGGVGSMMRGDIWAILRAINELVVADHNSEWFKRVGWEPVIRKVWADDIPKYAAADKDHNFGVGVSSGGTVSFGSGIERCSSLSTIMRNWGGEHLCPGKNFSG
ncbi:hypothetical protein Tco_0304154 [Tanacetum coccineum]